MEPDSKTLDFEQIPGQGVFEFPDEAPADTHNLPALTSYSGRLHLRRFTVSDMIELTPVLQGSSVWSQGYLGVDALPTTIESCQEMLESRHLVSAGFAILNTDRLLIGAVTVVRNPEAGWASICHMVMRPEVWHIDSRLETVYTLLDWLYSDGFERIEMSIDPLNAPEANTLVKGGFTDEGVRRHAVRRYDGKWLNRRVLSMLAGEWASKRKAALGELLVRWERDLRNQGKPAAEPVRMEGQRADDTPSVTPEAGADEQRSRSFFTRSKKGKVASR